MAFPISDLGLRSGEKRALCCCCSDFGRVCVLADNGLDSALATGLDSDFGALADAEPAFGFDFETGILCKKTTTEFNFEKGRV